MIKNLRFMVDIANALGKTDDVATYTAMAQQSAAAFLQAYYRTDKEGRYTFTDASLTQMSALALALDLFPPPPPQAEDPALSPLQSSFGQPGSAMTTAQRAAANEALRRSIIQANNHSIAGIIGQAPLFPALSRASAVADGSTGLSLAALALEMNLQTTYPSFGQEALQGATTLWEQFTGGGTHNHIMYCSVQELSSISTNDTIFCAIVHECNEKFYE